MKAGSMKYLTLIHQCNNLTSKIIKPKTSTTCKVLKAGMNEDESTT